MVTAHTPDSRTTGQLASPREEPCRLSSSAAAHSAGRPAAGLRLAPVHTVQAIIAAVADTFGVTTQYLTGPSRLPEMVDARKVAIRLLARRGLGPTAIGRLIGRDHSTVLHHQHIRLSDEQRIVLGELARDLGLPRQQRHTIDDSAARLPRET